MSFSNTAPLSYSQSEVVKYIDAQRGVAESIGGPAVRIVGLYSPATNDIYDPRPASNTATITAVAANTTSATFLSANTARKSCVISNPSAATLYLRYGTGTANSTNWTYAVYTGGVFEMNFIWTGAITGFLSTGTGTIQVTELF